MYDIRQLREIKCMRRFTMRITTIRINKSVMSQWSEEVTASLRVLQVVSLDVLLEQLLKRLRFKVSGGRTPRVLSKAEQLMKLLP